MGHVPRIKDFKEYGSIDITKIFNKYKSYHHFLTQIKDKDYNVSLTPIQEQMLHYISQKLATGMRVRDLLALQLLLDGKDNIIHRVTELLHDEYGLELSDLGKTNLINTLTNNFSVSSAKKTFKDCVFIEIYSSDYSISNIFKNALESDDFRSHIKELIGFGLELYTTKYKDSLVNSTPFALYEKYNYEQVCQLLEWPQSEVPLNIGGYKYHRETKTYPVFINYHKDEGIQDSIKYEDRFETPTLIKAISKNNRSLTSDDVVAAFDADKLGISMHLFVRKNKDDDESKEFYYLGPIHSTGEEYAKAITMASGTNAVELEYRLDIPVRDDIYDYLING